MNSRCVGSGGYWNVPYEKMSLVAIDLGMTLSNRILCSRSTLSFGILHHQAADLLEGKVCFLLLFGHHQV